MVVHRFAYRNCDGCGNWHAHMKNGRVHTRHDCAGAQAKEAARNVRRVVAHVRNLEANDAR